MRKLNLANILFMVLASAAVILLPVQSLFGEPCPQRGKNTQKSEHHQPVYFVRIFGGDFPIPTSYELNANAALKETNEHLEFGNPAIPLMNNPTKLSASDVGSIAIGSYLEYVKKNGRPFAKASAIQTTKCYGLAILITSATEPKLQRLGYTSVFIHDDNEYVEIDADNGNLWKALLKRFGKTIKKPAGRDCLIQP